MAAPGERIIAVELLAAMTTVFVADVFKNKTAPKPQQVAGIVLFYSATALVALAGPGPAKIAGGIGALVLLGIIAKHGADAFSAVGANTKQPYGAILASSPQGATSFFGAPTQQGVIAT